MSPVRNRLPQVSKAPESISNGMKVLVISGDKKFGPGNPRYELQRSVVDSLTVVYWGRGSLFPNIPESSYDVVTAQDSLWRGHFAWHVSRKLGARLNIQVHADIASYSWPLRLWARFNLRQANSVRVVSEKIKQQVLALGVRVPIFVLPVYVDLSRFKAIKPLTHAQKTILWIGRFEPEKDPLLAIEVLKEVRKGGREVKLVMLGAGSLEPQLRALATGLPIEFSGWKDPAEYLPIADVVLCTSLHESWGASIVEALAAGVPVVAPDVGVAREAGAIIAERAHLSEKIIEVLQHGTRGTLHLELLSAEAWAKQWRETLI